MKVIKWIFLGLLVLLGLFIGGTYWFLNSSKPQYHGELLLENLQGEVNIYFDNFGIPHIYASSETDAYFALGYVHAQERLFQMELLRRVGSGRLSEIFGPDLAKTDQFLRTIGINEIAKLSASTFLSQSETPYQKATMAYLQGVNSFIQHGPAPPEFTLLGIPKEEFTPEDIYRVVGYMGFSFNTAVRTDPLLTAINNNLGSDYLKDLIINTVRENTPIPTYMPVDSNSISEIARKVTAVLQALPVAQWMGSNSWVVSGEKTKSGYPMLANDTHIGFSQPAVWYEAHLEAPGLSFYGNHLAGFPFGLVGHTNFSAWGITIFPNDDMDFYREKSNPENAHQVWYKDRWESLKKRKEIIKIKGAENLEVDVFTSRHGPVINDVNPLVDSIEQHPVSFYWTYLQFPSKAIQSAYAWSHSTSMAEFREAVSWLEAPGLNVTYADRDGNIAWWTMARLLKRPEGVEPKMILDGSTGQDDPLGWYPFDMNPKSENPANGFVYSANNQPDSAFGIFHTGYYYPGLRGERIIELLSQKSDWDLESFKQMILDDRSPEYPETGNRIIALLDHDLTDTERQVAQVLQSWNGEHGQEAIGPSIYYPLINCIEKNTFEDELGKENFQVYPTTQVARRSLPFLLENDSSVWWDNVNTEKIEDRKFIINLSFRETVKQLVEDLGTDYQQWHWGKLHQLEHVHAIGRQKPLDKLFNVGPYPIPGGDEVINKMDFDKSSTPYKVKSGPAMRILVDLADMQNSLSVLPTGQSGHLMSKHYRDQAALYNAGKFRPQHMNRQAIMKEASRVLVLKPAKEDR